MADNNNQNNQGRGWHGDPQGHAQAGQKGGQTTAQKYGDEFYEEIGSKGGQAAQQSGSAHQLTDEERSRGGQRSSGKFQKGSNRAREAGRKGGSK